MFNSDQFRKFLCTALDAFKTDYTDDQVILICRHAQELIKWNSKTNLTTITDPREMAEKHFADSLLGIAYFDAQMRVLDMGTGGGFPGIPIKVFNPGIHLTLLDSSRKKVNFLKQASRSLKLTRVDAIHRRAEDLAGDAGHKSGYDVVVSRAFSSLLEFIHLSRPFLNQSGFMLAYKGSQGLEELQQVGQDNYRVETAHFTLPFSRAQRVIIKLMPVS
ncbi:MAG: 16S rRNA (guanine(527)-N(7))-methyltransferase RsmG [Desulfobacteraceae bacterium]|nr:MAG: 16S rRNA (guanine(527)-N(7))-methyltransferase RsmG [Desulfobacteraceae bacterium]